MAFIHWRVLLLYELNIDEEDKNHPLQEAFCRVLSLGQVPGRWSRLDLWLGLCYYICSSLVRERIPRPPMDPALRRHIRVEKFVEPDARWRYLQDYLGNHMMGRSFCVTESGLIGMGSGNMTRGGLVVVPFGCSTPILLRPEGRNSKYRYVGDVYIDGSCTVKLCNKWTLGVPIVWRRSA
jgi:hypothetical protein